MNHKRSRVSYQQVPRRSRKRRGPDGIYQIRIARMSNGGYTFSLGIPRDLGEALVNRGLDSQRFKVEVVPEGILYRRVD